MSKHAPSLLVALSLTTLFALAPAAASTAPPGGGTIAAEPATAVADTALNSDSPSSLCNNGSQQSPIDITTAYPYRWDYRTNRNYPTKVTAPRLRFVMFPSTLEISLESDGISAHINSGSYTRVNRDRYQLKEIRFRTPAEHLVNGYRYPAEIQLMHQHGDAMAVFSVFVQEGGSANPTLSEIINNAPDQIGETNTFRRRRLDTALLLPGSKGFFVYDGSLSSQPCTEQVTRIVMKTPIVASREQLLALRSLSGDTARPVQPLGQRTVLQTSY